MTIRLRCPQRKLFTAIRLSIKRDKDATGDVSQFGALATALAATIGTGNIIGVATAIALGGPGAVFWCWITGVFGIATKYAEGLLAIKYRVQTPTGKMLGGPPRAMAVATQIILPVPIVAARAVAKAPNCDTSPEASLSRLILKRMAVNSLRCGQRKRIVRKMCVPKSSIIIGHPQSKLLIEAKKSLISCMFCVVVVNTILFLPFYLYMFVAHRME